MKKKSTTSNPLPAIGMGATIVYHSDREPATIIQITHGGNRIVVQADIATRTDKNGMSESQTYEFAQDPNGSIFEATKRKDGSYRMKGGKTLIRIGSRQKYYDFSF